MRDFFKNLITFFYFMAAIILFYYAIIMTFATALINLILIALSVFFLLQGCDKIDKYNNLGKYNNHNNINNNNP
jgi:hypothetical protein